MRSVQPPDPRIREAIQLAVSAHDGQLRKDGRTPYVVHPIGVFRLLSGDLGCTDPDLLCAALLHDVLEDTQTPREVLENRFGAKVAGVVQELTLPPEFHGHLVADSVKTERLLLDVGRMSTGALLVKMCDRWDNMSDAKNALWGETKRKSFVAQTDKILEVVRFRVQRGGLSDSEAQTVGRAVQGILGTRLERVSRPIQ